MEVTQQEINQLKQARRIFDDSKKKSDRLRIPEKLAKMGFLSVDDFLRWNAAIVRKVLSDNTCLECDENMPPIIMTERSRQKIEREYLKPHLISHRLHIKKLANLPIDVKWRPRMGGI